MKELIIVAIAIEIGGVLALGCDIISRRFEKSKERKLMFANRQPLEFLDEANKAEFEDWLTNGKSFSYIAQELELAKVIAERDTYKQLCERALERSKEQCI